jgi:hypothetical protein
MDSMGLLSNYEDFMRDPQGVHVDYEDSTWTPRRRVGDCKIQVCPAADASLNASRVVPKLFWRCKWVVLSRQVKVMAEVIDTAPRVSRARFETREVARRVSWYRVYRGGVDKHVNVHGRYAVVK